MIKESIMTILSTFSEKQNLYQNMYIYFYHVILIIFNEKFEFQSQLECKNFIYLLILFLQKLTTTLCFIHDILDFLSIFEKNLSLYY